MTMIFKQSFSILEGARDISSVPGTSPQVLTVHPTDPTFWYSFNPSDEHTSRFEVLTAWTGTEFIARGFRYVGTTFAAGLVLHLYWRRIE